MRVGKIILALSHICLHKHRELRKFCACGDLPVLTTTPSLSCSFVTSCTEHLNTVGAAAVRDIHLSTVRPFGYIDPAVDAMLPLKGLCNDIGQERFSIFTSLALSVVGPKNTRSQRHLPRSVFVAVEFQG